MLFDGDALVVAEAAQHRLVGAQLFGALAPESFAHAVRQNAVPVGDRGDDPGDEVVLEREDLARVERAIVVLRPEMGARGRVNELHRDAQLRARLPEAPLHHVARGDLGGAARDDPEVREARQSGHDLFGQALGQCRDVGVAAAVLEGQHRDPEALVGAGRA